jgi:hypothetical protein
MRGEQISCEPSIIHHVRRTTMLSIVWSFKDRSLFRPFLCANRASRCCAEHSSSFKESKNSWESQKYGNCSRAETHQYSRRKPAIATPANATRSRSQTGAMQAAAAQHTEPTIKFNSTEKETGKKSRAAPIPRAIRRILEHDPSVAAVASSAPEDIKRKAERKRCYSRETKAW